MTDLGNRHANLVTLADLAGSKYFKKWGGEKKQSGEDPKPLPDPLVSAKRNKLLGFYFIFFLSSQPKINGEQALFQVLHVPFYRAHLKKAAVGGEPVERSLMRNSRKEIFRWSCKLFSSGFIHGLLQLWFVE